MNRIGLFPAAMAVLALAACQSSTATPSPGANKADAAFITNAYQIIEFDRQEGAITEKQAKDPRVRAIAAKLVDEANAYADRLKPVADAQGIKPPNVLRKDLRVRLTRMRLQPGLDADRGYLDDQIANHQETLNREKGMNPNEYTPSLMSLVQRGEDLVQRNLADLRALRQSLGEARR